jgi:hypothetical protein
MPYLLSLIHPSGLSYLFVRRILLIIIEIIKSALFSQESTMNETSEEQRLPGELPTQSYEPAAVRPVWISKPGSSNIVIFSW